MKEATGELNLAVIVAISVGILAAFFFGVMWPMINQNFQRNAQCSKAICDCKDAKNNGYKCTCHMPSASDTDDNTNYYGTDTFYCPFKG